MSTLAWEKSLSLWFISGPLVSECHLQAPQFGKCPQIESCGELLHVFSSTQGPQQSRYYSILLWEDLSNTFIRSYLKLEVLLFNFKYEHTEEERLICHSSYSLAEPESEFILPGFTVYGLMELGNGVLGYFLLLLFHDFNSLKIKWKKMCVM